MTQYNPSMELLSSPTNKHRNPAKVYGRPTLPGLSPRNGSLPDALAFKLPIPAGVINIVPKSSREDTLKIFKSKEKEDRELGVQGDEPIVKKGDVHLDSIRKNDTSWTVESIVGKGRKEYEKKKNQKIKGSMYVNDLWGKQYEGEIKRQTRIDAELKNTEYQKRKPLQLKLEEVVGYFSHRLPITARAGEGFKYLSPERSSQLQLLTESDNYTTTVSALQTDRPFYTEENSGYPSRTELKGELSPKNLLLPNIKAIHNRRASVVEKEDTVPYMASALTKIPTESIPFEYQKKNGLILAVPTELKMSRLNLNMLGDKSPTDVLMTTQVHQSLKPRKKNRQKSFYTKTKGALNNLLTLCESDRNSNKEIIHTIEGVKDIWLQGALDRQKMQNKTKKDELIMSMNKRRQKQFNKGSM